MKLIAGTPAPAATHGRGHHGIDDPLCLEGLSSRAAGETVDIRLELTEPGRSTAHCHIAEHNQDGMLFNFQVESTEPWRADAPVGRG